MARTTLNIDDPILLELKRVQKRDGRSLGRLVSDLVARALSEQQLSRPPARLAWRTFRMGPPTVDLEDKEALRRALGEG